MRFTIFQESRKGSRKVYQDRVAYSYGRDTLMLVIADGMGGHAGGEIAAQIAVHLRHLRRSMDLGFTEALIGLISMATGAGGVYGAARTRITHVERQIADVDDALHQHDDRTRAVGARLARIEGLLEQVVKRLDQIH